MALLKTISAGLKPSPSAKATISSPTAKKPVDVGLLKKPPSPSAIKPKPIPTPMKSPAKVEKPPAEGEKSPKTEKPLKLAITKSSIGSTIKTPTSAAKNPTTKSLTVETKTSVRNVIKSAPRTPESKLPSSKTEMIVRSAPEKGAAGRSNVNSTSGLKISPTSSVKSLSTAVKSVSLPVKSPASPVKSSVSPGKSPASPTRSLSSPMKSSASPVKSASSSVKTSSPGKSVSSPAKPVSSPAKSVPSSVKSVLPVISVSSSAKSGSPAKSISSPMKSKLASAEVSKDTKTKSVTGLIKKPASSIKSPIKTMTSPSAAKLKLSPSKASKAASPSTKIASKPCAAKTMTVKVTNPIVETSDPCLATEPTEKCEELSITEFGVDNKSFDVAQAFKVAEQLIKIQSNDRNLETMIESYENTPMVNWDDVITPCDNSAPNSNLEQAIGDISTRIPQDVISKYDNCIIEMNDLNVRLDSSNNSTTEPEDGLASEHRNENQSVIEIIDLTSSSESGSTKNDEKCFSDGVSSTSISSESVETESNDLANEIVPRCADLIRFDEENVLPEWTITIDEFSLDLNSEENRPLVILEKENLVVEKTSCSVSMSYADVLKKMPRVLVNSTNLQCCKKEPKLNVNLEIKQFQMLKKVEALYSNGTVFINNIENNYQSCDDNYYFEEPEYCEIRKKKCKKIKHLSKRHFRNINREPEGIENQPDVYVTSVWKNIY